MGLESMRVLDLSQDFSMHTPAFASYDGPSIKWVKRLAFDKVGGQEITSTLHVGTHLDGPVHFWSAGKTIGELPLPWLVGSAVVVDLERMGVGDYQLYGPEHFERWERETGLKVERDDILIIHTGYHRFYNENWVDRGQVDETRYFVRHPGPTREFAEWVLDRGVRWLAVDAGWADHPMNTVIRKIRPDEAEDAEAALGRSLDELFPRQDLQIMHTLLFPHDVIHIENLGGQIDEVLDQRIQFGCFPWKFVGGEAAFCRAVAFLEEEAHDRGRPRDPLHLPVPGGPAGGGLPRLPPGHRGRRVGAAGPPQRRRAVPREDRADLQPGDPGADQLPAVDPADREGLRHEVGVGVPAQRAQVRPPEPHRAVHPLRDREGASRSRCSRGRWPPTSGSGRWGRWPPSTSPPPTPG